MLKKVFIIYFYLSIVLLTNFSSSIFAEVENQSKKTKESDEYSELKKQLDEIDNEIAKIQKENETLKSEITILRNENQNVIKVMENNSSNISLMLTIVGIIFGLGGILVTFISLKAVSTYINYKFDNKVETAFNARFDGIKSDLYKTIGGNVDEIILEKLEKWDQKFTKLYQIVKR